MADTSANHRQAPLTEKLTIPLQKLAEDAVVPHEAYEGDAGVDLCALEAVDLAPFERRLIPTGLAIAIPRGFGGFVLPRSGMAIKKGLSLANTPGLIDSNYRGELKVAAINLDAKNTIHIDKGDRIAQLVIMRVAEVSFQERDSLDETERGAGGFGSSGIQAH
ncbi:MAG: dUTP diphosphatase [Eggerthellaceae bacterium]|jgi:dUTP pyrophosphatase